MKYKTFYKYLGSLSLFFLLTTQASAVADFTIDFLNLAQSRPDFFEPFNKIKMKEAWGAINVANPLRFVKIGIIDSGLDASGERHPEFRGVDLGNTPNDAKTDSEPADVPTASAGHGTQVAGIIGANNISFPVPSVYEFPQMNGILSGVQNLNYTLEMRRPTLLFGTIFSTDAWSVFAEINKLVGEGVDIINISNGSPYFPLVHDFWFLPTLTLLDNILFVVSAGNDDSSVSRFGLGDQMPANYGESFDNVITVGATIFDDTRLSFSNFGSAVNIVAPGLSLYSPAPRGKGNFPLDTKDYDTNFGGTSASAPMVTSVAGLIKAIKPELTPAQIKQILIETADPIQTGETDKRIGTGCYSNPNDPVNTGCRLNAEKAVCHPFVLNCTPPPPPCPLAAPPFQDIVLSEDTIIPQEAICVIPRSLFVPQGITLTLEPGAIFKFPPAGFFAELVVDGILNVNGTQSQPVIFTSLQDDTAGGDTNNDGPSTGSPGNWTRIFVREGGTANISNAIIRYAGFFQPPAPSFLQGGIVARKGSLSLNNTRVTQNQGINFFLIESTTTIVFSEIDNSGLGIFQFQGTTTVNQSSVHHTGTGINIPVSYLAGKLLLNNNNFHDNNFPMVISPETDFTHSGNTAVSNSLNGIGMQGRLFSERIWTKDNIPYVVVGQDGLTPVTIAAGAMLNIDPDVIIKFPPAGFFSEIAVEGILNVNGTQAEPVIFTSIKDDTVGGDTNNDGLSTVPQAGDWTRIFVRDGGTANMSNTLIRYAGFFQAPNPAFLQGGVVVQNGTLSLNNIRLTQNFGFDLLQTESTTTIQDSEIDNSATGIYFGSGRMEITNSSFHNLGQGIFSPASSFPSTLVSTNNIFQQNSIPLFLSPQVNFIHSGNTALNNAINGIGMEGAIFLNQSRTWTKDNFPYIIFSEEATSSVFVFPGSTLTVDSGVVVKFATPFSSFEIQGVLNVNGTPLQPVFFTSLKDDTVGGDTNNDGTSTIPQAGNWHRINIENGGNASFNNSIIRYGGNQLGFLDFSASLFNGNGFLNIFRTHLTKNSVMNIFNRNGTTTIADSEIDNAAIGLNQDGGTVEVHQSSIHDNSQFGVSSQVPAIMNAQNNWWGSQTGPFHPTLNPTGTGNSVSDNVNFIPFLTADPVGGLP